MTEYVVAFRRHRETAGTQDSETRCKPKCHKISLANNLFPSSLAVFKLYASTHPLSWWAVYIRDLSLFLNMPPNQQVHWFVTKIYIDFANFTTIKYFKHNFAALIYFTVADGIAWTWRSVASDVPGKFQSDCKSLNPNPAASIVHEILR